MRAHRLFTLEFLKLPLFLLRAISPVTLRVRTRSTPGAYASKVLAAGNTSSYSSARSRPPTRVQELPACTRLASPPRKSRVEPLERLHGKLAVGHDRCRGTATDQGVARALAERVRAGVVRPRTSKQTTGIRRIICCCPRRFRRTVDRQDRALLFASRSRTRTRAGRAREGVWSPP